MAKLVKIGDFDVLQSYKAFTWFEAVALAEKVNHDAVGGFSDWTLPDMDTLKALCWVSDGKGGWYWSSTNHPHNSLLAWGVHFGMICIRPDAKRSTNRVRLVRVGQMLAIAGQAEAMGKS